MIVGYGLVGSNLAHACRTAQVPYLVAEMNPELVKRGRAKSEPIAFGDAIHEAVLRGLGVTRARVLVSAIADPAATRTITVCARRLNPAIHIIVRTRHVREIAALHGLGADEVIPEEFETSVEIFTRVLSRYLIPKPDIDAVAAEIRAEDYGVLRSTPGAPARPRELSGVLPGQEVVVYRIEDGAAAAGRTLAELDLRQRHRVTLLALRRGEEVRSNPSGGRGSSRAMRSCFSGRPLRWRTRPRSLPLPPEHEQREVVVGGGVAAKRLHVFEEQFPHASGVELGALRAHVLEELLHRPLFVLPTVAYRLRNAVAEDEEHAAGVENGLGGGARHPRHSATGTPVESSVRDPDAASSAGGQCPALT